MKTVHILNPAAGQGGAMKYKASGSTYVTSGVGDACRFVKKTLEDACEDINFIIYGGDGTINEVVRAIIDSGSDRAYISLVPTGTGNDFVRTVNETGTECIEADVLTVDDGVSVNTVNTGFDLNVVLYASQLKKKPLISGSMAYILGVARALAGSFGMHIRVEYTDEQGKDGVFDGECLLTVAGNGNYYGGGFKVSPAASITDGLIDLMIVKKVSRFKFVSLVGKYKKGQHIDTQTGRPFKKFEDIIFYKKCRRVVISGINALCCDGEIVNTDRADIGVLPRAVRVLCNKDCLKA
ncbi:MAG: hypothetical protein J6K66_02480 [Clostridia bacterium]|nr:hypothetical protein [Clostridia bacterium]